ncbi:response regulator [Paramicrobacterium chengjingii]|uniref:Response regulator transcription factor n=1 Tax=Paramicrobacterium chengjingii TaxID=2769067 RepID=A0ABX6YIV5_9MICO|nr:response regulator transcription factor [Microbacterium chengjingii]QPZ38691.1 response regulator transcription factor [Microbacterium chengjingii]
MIRVLVADDHPIVRSGIVGLLTDAAGIEVAGEAATGTEAVDRALALRPDLVLMDLRMPELDGTEATLAITTELPETRVLVLTTYESDDHILGAIEAGASGYLLKAAPSDEIIAGVRAVVEGDTVLAPSIAATLVKRMQRPDEPTAVSLSPRETDVLRLVAAGKSNPQIGRELFIGEATVKTHLLHTYEKLGVSDRTQAVLRALDLGVIDRDSSGR